jgi:acetyl-CoA acetyltransferase
MRGMSCDVWERLRREEQLHREEWARFAHSGHLHGQENLKAQQLATECMTKWKEANRRIALHMGGTCPDCAD